MVEMCIRDSLYYFKALAETKNRRQTAQSLSITQPTLSQAISKLEDVYKRQM